MNTQTQAQIEELEHLINYCPMPTRLRSKLLLELGSLRFQLINLNTI